MKDIDTIIMKGTEFETTIRKRINLIIRNQGIDKAFCPLCDECLPQTIYTDKSIWKRFCKKNNIDGGLVCPRCMAKDISITTEHINSIQSYSCSKPTFTIEDIGSCGDFGELANVVMFLDFETQTTIHNFLIDRRKEINKQFSREAL